MQEKSFTAQQVMRFMFSAAKTALCLEINRERAGWLKQEAIANVAYQTKKLKFHPKNFSGMKSDGHAV